MKILCLDIGNTHTHYAVMEARRSVFSGTLKTGEIDDAQNGVPALLRSPELAIFDVAGVSFCSVVPVATEKVFRVLGQIAPEMPLCRVFHGNCPGLGIHYPFPREIGPDRLANCLGAQARFGAPAVIIDMGTAVTFDILSEQGYEGGIIAPGLEIMTRYLHEQTALLPALNPEELMLSENAEGVGKSTTSAMKLGCTVGFAGMIEKLLDTVLAQLECWNIRDPKIIATGGCAGVLPREWKARIRWAPYITLQGLEEAFLRGGKNGAR